MSEQYIVVHIDGYNGIRAWLSGPYPSEDVAKGTAMFFWKDNQYEFDSGHQPDHYLVLSVPDASGISVVEPMSMATMTGVTAVPDDDWSEELSRRMEEAAEAERDIFDELSDEESMALDFTLPDWREQVRKYFAEVEEG